MFKKKDFVFQIMFNFVFAALFTWFAVDYVRETGWGFLPVVFILFATSDVVRGAKILNLYWQIKKSNKPQ